MTAKSCMSFRNGDVAFQFLAREKDYIEIESYDTVVEGRSVQLFYSSIYLDRKQVAELVNWLDKWATQP